MPISVKIMPKRAISPTPPANRLVVALAYDGLCTFEFGVAVEVFGLDRPEMGPDWYRFAVAALEPGPLRAAGGVRVTADGGAGLLAAAGTILVPGWRGAREPVPDAIRVALRAAHARGARVLSLCSPASSSSSSPPRGCWRGGGRRRTGATWTRFAPLTRTSRWCPTCSTWTRAAC
jgi:AraC family transcriptional regulator, transcriptional activator FtrA